MTQLLTTPPEKPTGTHHPNQIYTHKHQPGDDVCYYSDTTKNGVRSFLFARVRIIACGYDKNRNPRYEVENLDHIRVNRGTASRSSIKDNRYPAAYHLDRHCFPVEKWDDQIQRKVNFTKAIAKN